MAARHVHDRPEAGEVVRVQHRLPGEVRQAGHRVVEEFREAPVLFEVRPRVHAADLLDDRPTRAHRVDQV
jgi:hypothetical protein